MIDYNCEDCKFRGTKECPFYSSHGILIIKCPKYEKLEKGKRILRIMLE